MTGRGVIVAVAATLCGLAAAEADEASVQAALGKGNLRTQVGVSSYYGPGFHGRPTATGERFSINGLTAAHKTLPIPSYARVTNLSNGRSIVVRLNDRGPYAGGRILDVSSRVAKLLAFHGGLEKVKLDYLGMAGPEGAEDQRALLATLNTGEAPVEVASEDGESSVARSAPTPAKPAPVPPRKPPALIKVAAAPEKSAPALAYSASAPRAPAAAALEAAVRPVAPPPPAPVEPLGLAAKLDASVRQLQAALETAHEVAEHAANNAAKTVSPYGELLVAPFKPVVQAAK